MNINMINVVRLFLQIILFIEIIIAFKTPQISLFAFMASFHIFKCFKVF